MKSLRQRLESACVLSELRETLKNSTRVVAWYAHGPGDQSPLDTATVRGPYGRWFYVNGGADYPKNVAYVADDAKYAAASMNAIPKLVPLLSALIEVAEAHAAWLDWEREQIKRDGPYVGEQINALIARGNAALARVSELCGEGKE